MSDHEDHTPQAYLRAVQQDGLALEHVPEQLKCLVAVQNHGAAMNHVPVHLEYQIF